MKNDNKVSGQDPAKLPNDSINENLTARPHNTAPMGADEADPDIVTRSMDYGDSNLKDAKESGYTDEKGNAVSKARKDVTGSPTGAYTDIGAGRSSAVHHHTDKKNETHH